MTSASQLGSTGIILQFDLSRNIDAAAVTYKPPSTRLAASCRPTCRKSDYRKVNPADAPT